MKGIRSSFTVLCSTTIKPTMPNTTMATQILVSISYFMTFFCISMFGAVVKMEVFSYAWITGTAVHRFTTSGEC